MKRAAVVTMCFILGSFVCTSFAAEVSLFGPKPYVRTAGATDVFQDAFTALPGEGMIIVRNGSMDGTGRISDAISSASVYVNGERILGPDDFNGNIYLLQGPVHLLENNSITVELASGPGSYLIVEIKQEGQLTQPTVVINADPENIMAGESAVLTWSSTNADTAVIDQGIGSVASNGSVTVSPAETTTYLITVTGPGGTATGGVTVNVSSLEISITSPDNGNTTTRTHITVRGSVANALGNEVGVNVNRIVAMVYGDQFVANHVLLIDGENTITAVATDAVGNTARSSVTITAEPTERLIRIRAITESGVSPLETTLKVDGSFEFPKSSISYTGPGTVEILEGTNDNEYIVKMTATGIYFFTGEVTDDQNNLYTDTVAICVLDKEQLDVLLREKWNGMKAALGKGDIDGAMAYFAYGSRDNYQRMFTSLTKEKLQGIVSEMREIEKIQFDENRATYGINRAETIKGVVHDVTHYIFFVKDGRGLWKIESF